MIIRKGTLHPFSLSSKQNFFKFSFSWYGFDSLKSVHDNTNFQRIILLDNIRHIYVIIGVRVSVYRKLWIPVLLLSRSLKIGVNFAFVLTPKSAVKSSRWTRRIFSIQFLWSSPYMKTLSILFYPGGKVREQVRDQVRDRVQDRIRRCLPHRIQVHS